MIFGSAPIAFQGSSLKVHWLKASKTVMYSHVFPAPVHNSANGGNSRQWKQTPDMLSAGYSGSYQNHHPSGSDLSSMDTSSLRSFTVTSSTSTQHDTSYNHRQRLPLPLEFGHMDRLQGPRLSSNSGVDSGYGGTDPWTLSTNSYRHPLSSHRSSLASICSDFECFRRLSIDTSFDIPSAVPYTGSDDCSQYGSFHRRFSKNVETSFENRCTLADHIGHVDELNQVASSGQVTASDGCVGSKYRRNSETIELTRRKAFSGEVLSTATNYHGRPPSKKARLGVALCIQMNDMVMQEMETFCSEHISIFESMLCRLRVSAEKACYRWPQFLQVCQRLIIDRCFLTHFLCLDYARSMALYTAMVDGFLHNASFDTSSLDNVEQRNRYRRATEQDILQSHDSYNREQLHERSLLTAVVG